MVNKIVFGVLVAYLLMGVIVYRADPTGLSYEIETDEDYINLTIDNRLQTSSYDIKTNETYINTTIDNRLVTYDDTVLLANVSDNSDKIGVIEGDYLTSADIFDDTFLLANVSDNRDLIGILEDNVSDNRDLIGAIVDFDDTILLANVSDNRDLIGAIVDFDDTILLANVSDNSDKIGVIEGDYLTSFDIFDDTVLLANVSNNRDLIGAIDQDFVKEVDIDTIAELNTIITDATFYDGDQSLKTTDSPEFASLDVSAFIGGSPYIFRSTTTFNETVHGILRIDTYLSHSAFRGTLAQFSGSDRGTTAADYGEFGYYGILSSNQAGYFVVNSPNGLAPTGAGTKNLGNPSHKWATVYRNAEASDWFISKDFTHIYIKDGIRYSDIAYYEDLINENIIETCTSDVQGYNILGFESIPYYKVCTEDGWAFKTGKTIEDVKTFMNNNKVQVDENINNLIYEGELLTNSKGFKKEGNKTNFDILKSIKVKEDGRIDHNLIDENLKTGEHISIDKRIGLLEQTLSDLLNTLCEENKKYC